MLAPGTGNATPYSFLEAVVRLGQAG